MLSEVESLLEEARALAQADDDGDSYWRAVTALHTKPKQAVFEKCVAWASSHDAKERRLAADILGQLGCTDRAYPFRAATIPVLRALLGDADGNVLQAALIALGHLGAEESVEEVVALSRHRDPAVRHAVAFALLEENSAAAAATMIELSKDDDAMVRDWSTFGLGSMVELDTPDLRNALLARVDDPDSDTRAEALAGLVSRRDLRVLPALHRALESDSVGSLEVEAARDLASPDLLAPLLRLRTWWDVDTDLLDAAIARCSSDTEPEAG